MSRLGGRRQRRLRAAFLAGLRGHTTAAPESGPPLTGMPPSVPRLDPPDTVIAAEPDSLPDQPMTAADAEPLIAKDIA